MCVGIGAGIGSRDQTILRMQINFKPRTRQNRETRSHNTQTLRPHTAGNTLAIGI